MSGKTSRVRKILTVLSASLALGAAVAPAHAASYFLSNFNIDVGGGVLYGHLTTDTPVGASNTITGLTGVFKERAPGVTTGTDFKKNFTTLTLLPAGTAPFGSAGNTATDNTWLNGKSTTGPYLTTGGFTFGYSPDPDDKYQLYWKAGDTAPSGCWSQLDCQILIRFTFSNVPEPNTWLLMMLGLGLVGVGVRSRRMRLTDLTQSV